MKDVIIYGQDHLNIKERSSQNIRKDPLQPIQGKKKIDVPETLNKKIESREVDFPVESPFEKVVSSLSQASKNISNDCCEAIIQNELVMAMMNNGIHSLIYNHHGVEDHSSEPIIISDKDIVSVINSIPQDIPVLMAEIIDKECFNSSSNHNARDASEVFSKDICDESTDRLIENQLVSNIGSEGQIVHALEGLSIPKNFALEENTNVFRIVENYFNQKLSMQLSMIPDQTERSSINTLKVQMRPDSPDNVVATLCLSGNKLSVKLQVESGYLYHKIRNDRQDIVDALNSSGYTMDRFDIDFVDIGSSNLDQNSMNSSTQQENLTQSEDFGKKKTHLPERKNIGEKIPPEGENNRNNYYDGEVIGTYSGYIYV
ncbi:MAG: flagellar hook-length control protein FliK [Candidatus Liberibacter ctenarytainae]|uniref:Flagellar hook-length control protein FliK n=1 Tax=Candidatus Liberibacter ctenarytainae TaxID=2020335 RepID=A0A937AKL9_9HYPH|nr:flagellar hook-length control protein FliK [Candidatus Liberibacter ctenarytainae]